MKIPKNYYPTYHNGCNPIHPVRDWCKVRRLIRAARRGEKIPPIVIAGWRGNGHMLTGTHRSAANDIMMMLGNEDYLIPLTHLDDLDPEIQSAVNELLDNDDFSGINDLLDK